LRFRLRRTPAPLNLNPDFPGDSPYLMQRSERFSDDFIDKKKEVRLK